MRQVPGRSRCSRRQLEGRGGLAYRGNVPRNTTTRLASTMTRSVGRHSANEGALAWNYTPPTASASGGFTPLCWGRLARRWERWGGCGCGGIVWRCLKSGRIPSDGVGGGEPGDTHDAAGGERPTRIGAEDDRFSQHAKSRFSGSATTMRLALDRLEARGAGGCCLPWMMTSG